MSVKRTDYILVGVDLKKSPKEHYYGDFEELDDKYSGQEEVGKIAFVEDVYGGSYFIIGEVLQTSDGYSDNGLDYNLFGKEHEVEDAKLRVKAFLKERFGIVSIPHLIIKTQWT